MTQGTRPPVGSTGTLRIEAGKYYRTRDGRKVGPIYLGRDGEYSGFPWTEKGPNAFGRWSDKGEDGETCMMGKTDGDIIAEWQDNQPPHIVTHEGRDYDLTKLETPFGLLMENAPPVAEALRAWPHGVEMMTYSGRMIEYNFPDMRGKRGAVWRAKPAPAETRVSCCRGVAGVGGKYGTCIKRPDGSIDWSTWEPEA